MRQLIKNSVIATPARDGGSAFAIIAETRHIDLFAAENVADNAEDKDMEEADVHVQESPDADFDLDW